MEPEHLRTKLVKFPYRVHAEHMRAQHAVIQSTIMTEHMRENTLASFPAGGGTQYGIIFASRDDTMRFAEAFRASPHRYHPLGKTELVTLRLGPPRTDEMKSKGVLLGRVYPEINQGAFRDRVRPSFPRNAPSRTEISIALDSGELREVARVVFDETGSERTIARIEVAQEVLGDSAMTRGIRTATGHEPILIGAPSGSTVPSS